MAKEGDGEKPKKKRGRPKGSKNKTTEAVPKGKTTMSAADVAALAEAEAKSALAKAAAAKAAADEAAQKEYEAAAAEVKEAEELESFTNKRGQEWIFRREMGEPEFWLDKEGRAPRRPVLSKDEEEDISKKVEIPTDQTPKYNPEHMLSPEYRGTSNYEIGIKAQREETQQRLARLKGDPNSSPEEIKMAEEDLKTLDYLYENFHDGMNVFRTAKGGRDRIKE